MKHLGVFRYRLWPVLVCLILQIVLLDSSPLFAAAATNSPSVLQPQKTVLGSVNSTGHIMDPIHSEAVDGCHIALIILADQNSPKAQVELDGKIVPGFDDVVWSSLKFTHDGRHLVFVAKQDGKFMVVFDGKSGPAFDQIGSKGMLDAGVVPLLDPIGTRIAYSARNGDKWLLVVDGKPGPESEPNRDPWFSPKGKHVVSFNELAKNKFQPIIDLTLEPITDSFNDGFIFSPDDEHVAYVSSLTGTGSRLVVDGIAGALFPAIGYEIFSPDSKRVAYIAGEYLKPQQVVVDGVPGPLFENEIVENTLHFSPDGKHVVYEGRQANDSVVIMVDGKPLPDGWSEPTYSADGKHMAYLTSLPEGQQRLVIDATPTALIGPNATVPINGTVLRIPDNLSNFSSLFSPDGKHVASVVGVNRQKTEKNRAFLDGALGPEFDEIDRTTLKFSADSQHLAYVAKNGSKKQVVFDGVAGPEFDSIAKGFPIFSPEGAHYAYAAKEGELWQVVLDGKPGPDLYDVDSDSIKFSPGGQRLIYLSRIGYQQEVVVNTTSGLKFDQVRKQSLAFSPDGKHYTFVAKNSNGKWQAVIDGVPGPEFDDISDKNVIYGSDGYHWAYVAKQGGVQKLIVDNNPGQDFHSIEAGPVVCNDGRLEFLAYEGNGPAMNLVRVSLPGFDEGRP